MKSSIMSVVMALGLVAIGVSVGVAAINYGETDESPGLMLIGVLLIVGSLGLGVRVAWRGSLNNMYLVGSCIAVFATLLVLLWYADRATEYDSPGPMFLAPLVVGLIGTMIARFRPKGMARALFASAIAQALFGAGAMIAWGQYLEISIFTGFFIALWIGSALLFRNSARVSSEPNPV